VLAVKLSLFDSFSETLVMNEMPTWKFSQKRLLRVFAHHALKFFNLDIKFLALNNIPAVIFRKVAGVGTGQEVIQSFICRQFHPNEPLIGIEFFLDFSIFAFFPFFFIGRLADKRVLDMLAAGETAFA
jgi:hypothetical protein